MLAVITERAVIPGRERLVLNLLKQLQVQAAKAPGFLSTVAYRDLEAPTRLVVISRSVCQGRGAARDGAGHGWTQHTRPAVSDGAPAR
jgi:hypothetical protein